MTARELIEAQADPYDFDAKHFLSRRTEISKVVAEMGYTPFTPTRGVADGVKIYRKSFSFNPPLVMLKSTSRVEFARVFVRYKQTSEAWENKWCRVRIRFGYNNPELGSRVFNGHYYTQTLSAPKTTMAAQALMGLVDDTARLLKKVDEIILTAKGSLGTVEAKLRRHGFRLVR